MCCIGLHIILTITYTFPVVHNYKENWTSNQEFLEFVINTFIAKTMFDSRVIQLGKMRCLLL